MFSSLSYFPAVYYCSLSPPLAHRGDLVSLILLICDSVLLSMFVTKSFFLLHDYQEDFPQISPPWEKGLVKAVIGMPTECVMSALWI